MICFLLFVKLKMKKLKIVVDPLCPLCHFGNFVAEAQGAESGKFLCR